jgi:hypothetical protein
MEELTFYDAGPKPDWAVKETKPLAAFPPPARGGPANFLRPGAGLLRGRLYARAPPALWGTCIGRAAPLLPLSNRQCGLPALPLLNVAGGPIRSRLVADGSLPDELPPGRPGDAPPGGGPGGPPAGSMARADSWRRSSEGVPIEGGRPGERWGPGGPTTPVSSLSLARALSARQPRPVAS